MLERLVIESPVLFVDVSPIALHVSLKGFADDCARQLPKRSRRDDSLTERKLGLHADGPFLLFGGWMPHVI